MQLIIKNMAAAGKLALILAVLVFAFQTSAFAQTTTASMSAQAGLVSEFEVNGLKVLVKRRPNSQTVAAGLFFRGGARNLTPQNAGIEDLMLNAATEGSQKFPREALRRELARTGASISSGTNYDFSVLALASTLQTFDRTWEMFTDIAMNPAFSSDDVERARKRLIAALSDDEDDPDGLLQVLVNRTIYARSSYANDPGGTTANLAKFSVADLRAYHSRAMQTSRLLLVIVGDLDASILQQRIAASFGKLPRGDYKETPAAGLEFSRPTLDVTQRSLPTNYIEGVFNAPSIRDPDFYAMRVATTILRDRVFEEVRNKRNLSYAPSADMGTLALNTGNIYVTAVDANQSVNIMLKEIDKLKTVPVDERDISGVAGQFLTTYFLGMETNAAQAAALARYELIGGGWRNSEKFLEGIRSVKAADVQAVATKYMKNIRFVVIGDQNSIDRATFIRN